MTINQSRKVEPLVSVIIPNYNRMNLIGETIRSLMKQTRPPDEIIVVDDGSTDGSVAIIEQFEPHVRIVRQRNACPAVARNRGFSESKGQFIQFFDSDDLCARNKIERQLTALVEGGADVAYSPWLQAELRDGRALHREHALQQRPLPSGHSPEYFFLRSWITTLQPCLFRRELLERAGPFSTDLKPSEDSELLFRILLERPKLVHVADTLVLYRLHPSDQISGSALGSATRAADWLKFTTRIMSLIERHPDRFSWWDRHIWQREINSASFKLRSASNDGQVGQFADRGIRAMQMGRNVWRGFVRRLRRSAFGSSYGVGPLTSHQIELLRQLGYDPQLIR